MTTFGTFFSREEAELSQLFIEKGYLIRKVEDADMLDSIQLFISDCAAKFLDINAEEPIEFLNSVHKFIKVEQLNSLRLHVITKINSEPWFREGYFRLARNLLETIVGNELAMQAQISLSVQLPMDQSSLLPVHADVWSGDSPFEVVVWLPLVNCFGTKTMFLLPPEPTHNLHARFKEFEHKTSEDIYKSIESDLSWIRINYGEVLIFNQNLPHGNRVNEESESRWSMNCRFKAVFSPYFDKKLGEFFRPITLRAASRIGMAYRYPRVR